MIELPRLFIASSSGASVFAEGIQLNLQHIAEAVPWTQLMLPLSSNLIEALEKEIRQSDFAVFIFTGDDSGKIGDREYELVRDNVLIELGISVGSLGRDRTFIVVAKSYGNTLRIPSDLLGLTYANFDPAAYTVAKGNEKTVMGIAGSTIKNSILRLGRRPQYVVGPERRVRGVLSRGSTESYNSLADAGIRVADKRHEFMRDLRKSLLGREIIPSKYLYWFPHGTAHWLEICAKESYVFYKNSLKLLKSSSDSIAKQIVKHAGTSAIDFISVGSGDGKKDNILLRALSKSLKDQDYIYYYPVDISDALIGRAVPEALGSGLKPEKFRLKALVSDYAELPALASFYEERPNPNVFSVLGNTIGNAEEQIVFEAIDDSLLDNDLVLVEINVGEPSLTDVLLRDTANLEHDFSPLVAFNVQFMPDRIKHTIVDGLSIVPGTKSILTTFEDAVIDGVHVEQVKLAVVHYYKLDEFRMTMSDKMNVTIVGEWTSGGVAVFLGRREPPSPDA
jgi:hypothetical protein